MEYQKKFGMIVMVASITLATLMFAMSERTHCYGDLSGIYYVMNCLSLVFFEDIPGNEYSALINFPLKYALVFCVASFGAGILWYQGAIKAPNIRRGV